MNRKFLIILVAFVTIYCVCSRDYEEVKLQLYGLILPGKTTSNSNIVAKYIWRGGGNLREIAEVTIDHNANTVTITPFGLLDLRNRAFPDDIFWRTDTVSLGILPIGSYTIVLVGDSFTYYDTLDIPTDAADSLFQFHVTAIGRKTGQAVPNLPLVLYVYLPTDTVLRCITDSTGIAEITYSNSMIDSSCYCLRTDTSGVYIEFGQTFALLSVPEVITVGVFE